jgi:ribonuclease HI
MEYVALYGALKLVEQLGLGEVEIFTDSSILARTFHNKNFSNGSGNQTLQVIRTAFIKKASDIGLENISVNWVPREENVNADELTNLAYENDVWYGLDDVDKDTFADDLKSKIIAIDSV